MTGHVLILIKNFIIKESVNNPVSYKGQFWISDLWYRFALSFFAKLICQRIDLKTSTNAL